MQNRQGGSPMVIVGRGVAGQHQEKVQKVGFGAEEARTVSVVTGAQRTCSKA